MEKVNVKIRVLLNNEKKISLKQFQILDKDLKLISSKWISENSLEENLTPDIYVVRIVLPNGQKIEKILNLLDKKSKIVRLSEFKENTSRRNNQISELPLKTSATEISGVKYLDLLYKCTFSEFDYLYFTSARLSSSLDGFDTFKVIPEFNNFLKDSNEKTTKLKLQDRVVNRFEIKLIIGYSKFVLLPPVGTITLKLRAKEGFQYIENDYEISVYLPNVKAQALLELLNSGEINRAKSLMENFDVAENLLYDKMIDPTSAAIGGYFLLKTRELQRLHGWAYNLAERFPWLPDGAIIHAWQMILQDGDKYSFEIRKRLLEAWKTGYPIFTEGLRLLYEGLVRCSFFFGEDDLEVKKALLETKALLAVADLSQKTTTYSVFNSDEVGNAIRKSFFVY